MFSRYYRCTQLCDHCLAEQHTGTTAEFHYTNLDKHAPYSLTQLSHQLYLALDSHSLSPWRAVPGWTLESCGWDLLHNIYLGVGRDLFASVLRALFLEGWYQDYGNTEEEVLRAITIEMRQCCKERGRFGYR